jgi:hypothetical protein
MGKLSTHTHECPCCGTKWECGEANYQDECPYPIKTLCTKCWSKEKPKKDSPGEPALRTRLATAQRSYKPTVG